jgi:hypothetical protein
MMIATGCLLLASLSMPLLSARMFPYSPLAVHEADPGHSPLAARVVTA